MSDSGWPRVGAVGMSPVGVTLSPDIAAKLGAAAKPTVNPAATTMAAAQGRIAQLEWEAREYFNKWRGLEAEMENMRVLLARAQDEARQARAARVTATLPPLADAEDLFGLSGDYSPAEVRARFAGLIRQVDADVAGAKGLARRVTEAREVIKTAKGWR